MAEKQQWAGAIVALEGPKRIVTTQLRLLPSSPRILVLPALHEYIPEPTSFLDVFDATAYIRQVNAAMKRRHREALKFLQYGTEENKRLVFLHGGTASAQALCLQALMHHETAGDRTSAETALGHLTRHGLAGLAKAGEERLYPAPRLYGGCQEEGEAGAEENECLDPSTRAMRAADALDRQTANLQRSNDIDLTMQSNSHLRSASLPLYGYAETPIGEAVPFLVFGHSSAEAATPRDWQAAKRSLGSLDETPRFSIVQYDDGGMPAVFGFDDFPTGGGGVGGGGLSAASGENDYATSSTPRDPGHSQPRNSAATADAISPMSDVCSLRSVGKVEYGRAAILDVRRAASVRKDALIGIGVNAQGKATLAHERRPQQHHHHFQDRDQHLAAEPEVLSCRNYNTNNNTVLARKPSSAPKHAASASASAISSMTSLAHVEPTTNDDCPRTVLVKRTRPVVKLQPVPSGKKRRWQQSKSTFIDDDGEQADLNSLDSESESVFPRMEDLVIYLRSELTPEPLLDSALNSVRENYMQRSPPSSSSSSSYKASSRAGSPDSLKSHGHTDEETPMLASSETSSVPEHDELENNVTSECPVAPVAAVVEPTPVANPTMDEYDPFAYINPVYGMCELADTSLPAVAVAAAAPPAPPTPVETPPPPPSKDDEPVEADSREIQPSKRASVVQKELVAKLDSMICEIAVQPEQPPIAVQNSIRSVLSEHYPAEAKGYVQFQASSPLLLQDDEGLWRPIFPGSEMNRLPNFEGNQLKQILAVGLQSGVKKEYSARVISQIEKFGSEPTGSARCTRLDFRYLLANTMQSFTSQPLTSQTMENPFANPDLLATLMLPHLETYLSMHSDIRFLILEYPPEHLGTIIALQKLAGVDLVKIAQIVDSQSDDPMPFRSVRRASASISSTVSGYGSGSSLRSRASVSSSSMVSRGGHSVRSHRSSSLDLGKTKANFVLTSSASDKDIADFVAAVWNVPATGRPQTAPSADNQYYQSQLQRHQDNQLQEPRPPTPPPKPSSITSIKQESETSTMDDDASTIISNVTTSSNSSATNTTATAAAAATATATPKRKQKPAPLRAGNLSPFPKTTGPQSPALSSPAASVAHLKSALAPPVSSWSPPSTSAPSCTTVMSPAAAASVSSPAQDLRTPSPEHNSTGSGSGVYGHIAHARMSAVGGNNLRHKTSHSSVRTTSTYATTIGGFASASPASTPHIAYMTVSPPAGHKLTTPPASTSASKASSPATAAVPRYADSPPSFTPSFTPSLAPPSMLGGSDDAASIMTFDPADDSDFDQEARRLMPLFGRKRVRSKTGTQKALKVLGMAA